MFILTIFKVDAMRYCSTGGLEYECDAAPGDHDGHHHPQHQHTPRGQGKDQKTGELNKQPEVASNYILYKF